MNELRSGRPKSWDTYTSSDPRTPQPGLTADSDGPWRSFGNSSMNAISLGFVATAILISMFLIMAIFEHLFRAEPSFDLPERINQITSGSMGISKLAEEATAVPKTYASDCSVVMPGQQYPTHIAQPAPLPCPREGIRWPSHHHPHLRESMATTSKNLNGFYRQKKNAVDGGISKSKSSTLNQKTSPTDAAVFGSDFTKPPALIPHGFVDVRDDCDNNDDLLMQFDMNMAYGPCIGMSRLARWERARCLGMDPPKEIEKLLKGGILQQECLWNGRV